MDERNRTVVITSGTSGQPPGLVMRIVAGVVSAVTLVVAAFFGFVIFLTALGLVAIFGIVILVRVWWIGRKMR